MELYPRRSYRYEEEGTRAGLQSSSQHAAPAQVCQVHRFAFSQTQHSRCAAQHHGHDVRERYSVHSEGHLEMSLLLKDKSIILNGIG